MRPWAAIVIALASLQGAQAAMWADPAGDVAQTWAGSEQSVRATEGMDLVEFGFEETQTDFHFTLKMASPVADHDGPPNGWVTRAFMDRGAQTYVQELEFLPLLGGFSVRPPSWATVLRESDGHWAWALQPPIAVLADTYSWTVPRAVFIDESGAPPEIGGSFSNIRVVSSGSAMASDGGASLWSFTDQLPDAAWLNYTFVHGLAQMRAEFTSSAPFRASNGEAGLFYFPVTLESDEPRTLELQVHDVPNGWTVRLSDSVVDVDDPVEIMVEANVTFSHQHGGRDAFRLVATDGDAMAQIAMGVYYVEIPQPAGHHDRVYIHSEGDAADSLLYTTRTRVRGWPYINTLQDDPADSGNPIQPTRSGVLNVGGGQTETILHYDMRLQPRLLMGLEVLEGVRDFELTIDAAYPASGATLAGVFRVGRLGAPGGPDQMIDIGTLDAAPFDLVAGPNRIEGTMIGIPHSVPFVQGSVLQISLELRMPGPDVHVDTTSPYLLPGGWFDLPLAEYHESIANAAGFVQATTPSSEQTGNVEPADPARDSPGLPLLGLVAAVALALKRRVT